MSERDATGDAASPEASAHDGAATEIEVRVRYAETDQMGVVYHTNYLIYCEIGRTDYICRRLGRSYASLEAGGLRLAVADVSARYHAPARYDDRLIVATTLTRVKSRTMSFDYVISNAGTGQRLVSAKTTLVSLDADNKLVALPPDLRESLERVASPR